MEKKNPWLATMLLGAAVIVIDVLTLGSPVVLGAGAFLALVSAVVLIAQAVAGRRA